MNHIWIGLTGGPGCGKSEVGRIFRDFPGWECYDADRICHEIYMESDSLLVKQLEARWGADVRGADGTPDRKVIAEKIFNNEMEREWLNSVLHPEIFYRLESRAAASPANFILIETPLLFESGWNRKMRGNIAVWSPETVQMERLLARGWSEDHARKRIAAQYPAAKKLEMADWGIINRGSLESLREQCRMTAAGIEKKYQN